MTVLSGVQAALLLARGRPDGIGGVAARPRAVVESFWAIALCLPAFLCLRLVDWLQDGFPVHPAHDVTRELIFYLLGWLLFVELSRPLAAAFGKDERWPLFIAVWNWCNLVQYLLLVVAAIPALLGAPAIVSQTVSLVAIGWALWLEWFAARVTLDVNGLAAMTIVVLDLGVGIILALVTQALG